VNRMVRLVPSHGGYQPTKDGILCKETRTEWHARALDSQHVIRFRKSTMFPVLSMDRKFPCYRLVLPNNPGGEQHQNPQEGRLT
jgi:hypothetical protein